MFNEWPGQYLSTLQNTFLAQIQLIFKNYLLGFVFRSVLNRFHKTAAYFLALQKCRKHTHFTSLKTINKNLALILGARTFSTRLSEQHFLARLVRKNPFLRSNIIQERIEFAQKHEHEKNYVGIKKPRNIERRILGIDSKIFVRRPPV